MTDRDQNDYTRQQGIVDPADLRLPIIIVGAGGIGSPTAFALAKMGCRDITVIDDDLVERHNLPNQMLFTPDDLGLLKVDALANRLQMFDLTIKPIVGRVDSAWKFSGIVIFAVDSMASRKAILECVQYHAGVPLVIDARMGGTQAQLFAFDPRSKQSLRTYDDFCFDDDEAADEICTARAIIYVPQVISALIAQVVGRFANGWRPVDLEGAFIAMEDEVGVEWFQFRTQPQGGIDA